MRRETIRLLLPSALLGLMLVPVVDGGNSSKSLEPSVPDSVADETETTIPWNRRTVEHLYNRAGFGARDGMIVRALERTPEEVVDELLTGGRPVDPPHYVQGTLEDTRTGNDLPRSQKRRVRADRSREDREQLANYVGWWVDRMVAHDDPLRDRMTLFWHGLFATQHEMVKRSYDMIEQHRMIRGLAIESYSALLHGIAKDPAMLLFLDNQKNKKSSPNENLARELMELFSLGEGNYTEQDVKEVARALTGTSRDQIGNYRFVKKDHDPGRKTILGETGRYDTDGVVDLLLRQTACSRYIAGRIITYLEGTKPDELRLVEYAAFLKRKDYELRPFLRKLLLDPRFYREEVMESRVLGPVEFMVSSVRRLGIQVDGNFLLVASTELGQKLFDPPSVKGWDEGEAWINTGSLLGRGNTMGLMMGTIDLHETFKNKREERRSNRREASDEAKDMEDTESGEMQDEDDMGSAEDDMEETMMGDMAMEEEEEPKDDLPREIGRLVSALGSGYQPVLNINARLRRAEIVGDERIVSLMLDELLAIDAPRDTRARILAHFRQERLEAGLSEEEFLSQPDTAELILRRLAHLILSLPEAQLS